MTDTSNSLAPADAVPHGATLIERAIDKGLDLPTIEKLMELGERDQARRAEIAFNNAMARAQAAIPVVLKTRIGDKAKYEDLGDIADAVRSPLADNALSYRWEIEQDPDAVTVTCVVSHADGHTIRNALSAAILSAPVGRDSGKAAMNPVQALGATITYLQRYSLKAALGLAAAKDTDGRLPAAAQEQPDVEDLLAKIYNAKTADEIRALKPQIADLPVGPARKGVIDASNAKMAELAQTDG